MMGQNPLGQLSPPYRAAARAVVDEYARRPEVAGILLAGSVIRGEGGPTSDLDIWVIAEVPYRQRRSLVLAGVPVEIFLNSPAWMERGLAEEDMHALHMVGYGWPLYIRPDALAQVIDFQSRFRAAYERGPHPLSAEEFAARRYGVIDQFFDVEDMLTTDQASALLVMDLVLPAALDLFYARQGVWAPKLKRLLSDLANRDPDLHTAATRYLAAPTVAQRYAALRAVLALVLPEGFGLDQWCWESARQPIKA